MAGRRWRALLGVAGLLAVVPIGWNVGGANGDTATTSSTIPDLGCQPGHAWFTGDTYQKAVWGTGKWDAAYNFNTTSVAMSESTSTVSTVQYSISSTQSVDAGIIFASVAVNLTEGISYSHSDDASFSVTINDVPPGRWGILQGGNEYEIVVGDYDWLNMYCHVETLQHVVAAFPINLNPAEVAGVNSTDAPPWKQAP